MPEPEGKLIIINQLLVIQILLVESLSDSWVRGCTPVFIVKKEPKLKSTRRACCNAEMEVNSNWTTQNTIIPPPTRISLYACK
jgi:hypothetical protein